MAATTVNAQIVDAIATVGNATVGGAPSLALGMFFQAEAQAFALGLQNAVSIQHGMHQVGEAVVAAACARLLKQTGGGAPKP